MKRRQQIVFCKNVFPTRDKVNKWMDKNGMSKLPKHKIISFSVTFRVNRVNRNKFKKKSFRTKRIDKGVKEIKGCVKK